MGFGGRLEKAFAIVDADGDSAVICGVRGAALHDKSGHFICQVGWYRRSLLLSHVGQGLYFFAPP